MGWHKCAIDVAAESPQAESYPATDKYPDHDGDGRDLGLSANIMCC